MKKETFFKNLDKHLKHGANSDLYLYSNASFASPTYPIVDDKKTIARNGCLK